MQDERVRVGTGFGKEIFLLQRQRGRK